MLKQKDEVIIKQQAKEIEKKATENANKKFEYWKKKADAVLKYAPTVMLIMLLIILTVQFFQ